MGVRAMPWGTRPYEAALIKHPIADPDRPLELLRTIHLFDPCLPARSKSWMRGTPLAAVEAT